MQQIQHKYYCGHSYFLVILFIGVLDALVSQGSSFLFFFNQVIVYVKVWKGFWYPNYCMCEGEQVC